MYVWVHATYVHGTHGIQEMASDFQELPLQERVGILVRERETKHRSSGKSESYLLNHLSDFN